MSSKSPGLLVPLSFLILGVAAAVVIGIVAAVVSRAGWAPVGIFSLAVGFALGGAAAFLAKQCGVDCRTRLVAGTLVMALVATVAQHAWLYREYRRQWQAARDREPALALFNTEAAPMPPADYIAAELAAGRPLWWLIDMALVAASAVGVVLWSRRPVVIDSAWPPTPTLPDP
jgi:hypothetical protein